MKTVTKELVKRFGESGLSYRELSALTGISENGLQKLFGGKTADLYLLTLCKICEAFGTTASEVLCDFSIEKVLRAGSESFALVDNFEKLPIDKQCLLLEVSSAFLRK